MFRSGEVGTWTTSARRSTWEFVFNGGFARTAFGLGIVIFKVYVDFLSLWIPWSSLNEVQ